MTKLKRTMEYLHKHITFTDTFEHDKHRSGIQRRRNLVKMSRLKEPRSNVLPTDNSNRIKILLYYRTINETHIKRNLHPSSSTGGTLSMPKWKGKDWYHSWLNLVLRPLVTIAIEVSTKQWNADLLLIANSLSCASCHDIPNKASAVYI